MLARAGVGTTPVHGGLATKLAVGDPGWALLAHSLAPQFFGP